MSQTSGERNSSVTTAEPVRRIGLEAVEAISERLGESAALRERRLAAWREYERLPLPTRRDEEWRRTDVRALSLSDVQLSEAAVGPSDDIVGLAGDAAEWAGRLMIGASGEARRDVSAALDAQGVVFVDLATATRDYPTLLEEHLMATVTADGDKFAALHGALWSNGTLLYVPRGVRVELPLQSLHVAGAGAAAFPHTLLVAEPESEVALVDVYASPSAGADGFGFASGAVEIVARPGSRVRYASVQLWSDDAWSFGSHHEIVERDATVESLHVALGGKLSKATVRTSLVEPGAAAKMLGLVLGDGRQLFDHHTLQDHLAPRTTSELLYKSALKGQARSVFVGLIRAGREAQKTDAVQTSRNLLLNSKARADAIPMLEIEANDLRCTHAATVAPVDEDQLFFLRSRGLSKGAAQQMIVEGFVEQLIAELPTEQLRQEIRTRVAAKVAAE